jgi:hypothetical protein
MEQGVVLSGPALCRFGQGLLLGRKRDINQGCFSHLFGAELGFLPAVLGNSPIRSSVVRIVDIESGDFATAAFCVVDKS